MKITLPTAALFSLTLSSLPAQPPPGGGGNPAGREAAALAEPFVGITTDGKVQPGLFHIRSTGVTTAPVKKAADAFLAALTPEQRAKTTFPVDDIEWRKWMNVHRYVRQGVSFLEMSEAQRAAAFGLLRASLSAKGLKLSQDIMKLNHTLGELNNNNFTEYGEWLYHITVMGEPSTTKPWGWQIDGHHLIINYFVLGDQVVMSPVFVGSEPVIARAGKYRGVSILQEEQSRGLAMLRSLDDTQRKRAILDGNKTGNNNYAEGFKDNAVVPRTGVAGADLNAAQRAELLGLVELFVSNMDDGHAKVKMEDVRAHLDRTSFAWVGGSADDSVYYYRIHSPVVLIEFDHQRPANTRHLQKDPQQPIRDHIHVVVRTPNGNDYGKDLLRQHLLAHPH
jgi:hypothetical protein